MTRDDSSPATSTAAAPTLTELMESLAAAQRAPRKPIVLSWQVGDQPRFLFVVCGLVASQMETAAWVLKAGRGKGAPVVWEHLTNDPNMINSLIEAELPNTGRARKVSIGFLRTPTRTGVENPESSGEGGSEGDAEAVTGDQSGSPAEESAEPKDEAQAPAEIDQAVSTGDLPVYEHKGDEEESQHRAQNDITTEENLPTLQPSEEKQTDLTATGDLPVYDEGMQEAGENDVLLMESSAAKASTTTPSKATPPMQPTGDQATVQTSQRDVPQAQPKKNETAKIDSYDRGRDQAVLPKNAAQPALQKTTNAGRGQSAQENKQQRQINLVELLRLAEIVSQHDLDEAKSTAAHSGTDVLEVLVNAKKVPANMRDVVSTCKPLVENGTLSTARAIILLNYCYRTRSAFFDAVNDLGWELSRD